MNASKRKLASASWAILLLSIQGAVPGVGAAEDGSIPSPIRWERAGVRVPEISAAENGSTGVSSTSDLFIGGRREAGFGSGVLFSPFVATRHRPTINYTITELQLGYMLSDVKEAGWLRGNWELAGDGFGSALFEGPGSYVTGATLWLRYNFVPRKPLRLAPYLQGGAGVSFTDINRGIVGEAFNFNLDVGVGLRCFITQRWSLNLEYRYQHISNANLGNHNLGINAHGPLLGVSYFF